MAKSKGGRNKEKCKFYKDQKAVPNKLAKLRRHLKIHLNDSCAQTAIQKVR